MSDEQYQELLAKCMRKAEREKEEEERMSKTKKNMLVFDTTNLTSRDSDGRPALRVEEIEREVKEGAEAKFVPESPEMAAANREGQMQSLFNAAMREIHELATGALGYDQICEPIQAVRRLAQKFGSMKAELKEACAKIEHQRNWYGCRSQRLQQFAKEEMSEAQQKRFFSIMANGTADANEPPTYAQQYNMLKERAEQAEARLAEVIGIKDEIVEDREREYQRWREAEARAEAAETARDNCSKTAIELLGSSFCDTHGEKVKRLNFSAFSEWIKEMGCLPCAIARLATALAKNERAALSPAEADVSHWIGVSEEIERDRDRLRAVLREAIGELQVIEKRATAVVGLAAYEIEHIAAEARKSAQAALAAEQADDEKGEYSCGYNTVSGAFHKPGCTGECGVMNPSEAVEQRRMQRRKADDEKGVSNG